MRGAAGCLVAKLTAKIAAAAASSRAFKRLPPPAFFANLEFPAGSRIDPRNGHCRRQDQRFDRRHFVFKTGPAESANILSAILKTLAPKFEPRHAAPLRPSERRGVRPRANDRQPRQWVNRSAQAPPLSIRILTPPRRRTRSARRRHGPPYTDAPRRPAGLLLPTWARWGTPPAPLSGPSVARMQDTADIAADLCQDRHPNIHRPSRSAVALNFIPSANIQKRRLDGIANTLV